MEEFLARILNFIYEKDKLHFKKVNQNVQYLKSKYVYEFSELLNLVFYYFKKISIEPETVAHHYLKMIADMRKEGLYFYKNNKYRCANEQEAYVNVYSKSEIMTYYMHALLISQVLWKHHFELFIFFEKKVKMLFNNSQVKNVLDIGPGHGFFSFIIEKQFQTIEQISIVDISKTSLDMTKDILGIDNSKINYQLQNIFDYSEQNKFDFIIIGEVIEHLDQPEKVLQKISSLLSQNGIVWITTPTNSPAIDHVYLFKNRKEVHELVESCNLKIIEKCNYFAEEVSEEFALKNRVTDLVGVFCKKL